ncbi:MAG TPA: hypothetical protein VGK87_04440 [Anaerolineae bacterium]|jgi:hypothetical protein
MNRSHTSQLADWKRIAETGYTVAVQSVYYTMLIFVFFALIYDFGNVGYVFTITSNAARAAAQDAAKNVDMEVFKNTQQIRLSPDALTRAQAIVSDFADRKIVVTGLEISHLSTRDVIMLSAQAKANLPILSSLFGMEPVSIPVHAYAEPAFGINEEGQ